MTWFQQLLSRRRRYDDLSVSIEEHLDERTEELMADGLSRQAAAQKARREFGNATVLAERGREIWQCPTLESIWADLKFALRQLRKSPGFTLSAILILTLGIGINTAVFSVVHHILLEPLFAVLALLLSAVGIYGVVSYTTLERRREFGIRIALGANRSNVMAVVFRRGLLLTFAGISTGVIAALLISRVLSQLLFQVSPLDATSFFLSFLLLGVISIIACIIPALRAAHLDPAHVLRSE